ncbi:hypothetical protein B0T14DRAFT_564862 [Immersiella caudata]|uniref:Uncharacterized protein n=1 Tax=Immersiella caudata TaxID=314043 RepID=A0AA39WXL6_9PEZI|nr:hypothetical protein B0T14DRAFT_564862 [Immersiella caudata]
MSPDRLAQDKKRKREPEHHVRFCRLKREQEQYEGPHPLARVIELSSTHETGPVKPHYPIVESDKAARKPVRKIRQSRGSNKRAKRSNNKYTFVQSLFVIYHTVDLGLPWKETQKRFEKWFPERTEGGVQCQYYRLNARIPVIASEGLLDLGPFTKEELDDKKVVSQDPYPREGGVRYRIHELKCRQDRAVPLAERFPEEIAYGNHPWILPEHRNDQKIRLAAEKRARQRAEHLRYYVQKASKL